MSPNIAMSAGGMSSLVVNTRIGRNSMMRAPWSRTTHDPNRRYLACGCSNSSGDGRRDLSPSVAVAKALTFPPVSGWTCSRQRHLAEDVVQSTPPYHFFDNSDRVPSACMSSTI